jgi:adenylylsulfate kinase
MRGWAIWLTGLPGCGKTTRAKELLNLLDKSKMKVQHLRMDEIRHIITPEKKYTEEEREYAYRSLVLIAKFLTESGVNVIIDATGHKKEWRNMARGLIPNFMEVYVKCPIEISMERESKRKDNLVMGNLYEKALKRMKEGKDIDGLGQMIGIDVPYEESEKPDLIIESNKLDPEESSELILQSLKKLKKL